MACDCASHGMTFASLSKLGTVLGDNSVDADAVWLEGTFHGDVDLAVSLIESVQVAQNSLGAGQTVNSQPLVVGQGLTASTSILNTGFGFNYFPYLDIGATSWYGMGALSTNPLRISNCD